MNENRCSNKICNCILYNGLSIELKLCRNCRGDYPEGSGYVSNRILIQSSSELIAEQNRNENLHER